MIRTRCPSCRHDVDFRAEQCALLDGPDDEPVAYAFVCPRCGEPVVRPADRRTTALLVRGGASREGAAEAARMPHPEHPASGPPLTVDDLIDFHRLLDDACWFERLVELRPSSKNPTSSEPWAEHREGRSRRDDGEAPH